MRRSTWIPRKSCSAFRPCRRNRTIPAAGWRSMPRAIFILPRAITLSSTTPAATARSTNGWAARFTIHSAPPQTATIRAGKSSASIRSRMAPTAFRRAISFRRARRKLSRRFTSWAAGIRSASASMRGLAGCSGATSDRMRWNQAPSAGRRASMNSTSPNRRAISAGRISRPTTNRIGNTTSPRRKRARRSMRPGRSTSRRTTVGFAICHRRNPR